MILLNGEMHWSCPNCMTKQVSYTPDVVWHHCPGLNGFASPMVIDGTDCKVETVERGDYVGTERGLATDGEGKPIMSVVTTRADGSNDTAVFAPAARMFTHA